MGLGSAVRRCLLGAGLAGSMALAGMVGVVAQDLPTLDRAELEAVCEANAPDEAALANCLAVVAEILAPTEEPPAEVDDSELPFEPIRLRGRGDRVARFDAPEDVAAIADITHRGRSNFVVRAVGSDGDYDELLVNEIGNYEGTVIFNVFEGQHAAAFRIEAGGRWTVVIKPVGAARRWDTSAELAGRGDDVVVLSPPVEGFATTRIEHRGSSNFVVRAFTVDGESDLLVNEIGRYSGEVLLPDGAVLLEVGAVGGRWSMTPPD